MGRTVIKLVERRLDNAAVVVWGETKLVSEGRAIEAQEKLKQRGQRGWTAEVLRVPGLPDTHFERQVKVEFRLEGEPVAGAQLGLRRSFTSAGRWHCTIKDCQAHGSGASQLAALRHAIEALRDELLTLERAHIDQLEPAQRMRKRLLWTIVDEFESDLLGPGLSRLNMLGRVLCDDRGQLVFCPGSGEDERYDFAPNVEVSEDRTRGNLTGAGLAALECALALAKEGRSALRSVHRDADADGQPHPPAQIWSLTDVPGEPSVELVLPFYESRMEHAVKFGAEGNPVSGVVRVRWGEHAVMIGGDAPAAMFEQLQRRAPDQLRANVFRSPHHCGDVLTKPPPMQWRQASELYGAVGCDLVVHSVGTHNTHDHPNEIHLRGSRRADACHVMCTQMTKKCHSDLDSAGSWERLELAPVAYPTKLARRGRDRTRRVGVPCAGTVMVALDGDGLELFPNQDEHRRFVDRLEQPRCRR